MEAPTGAPSIFYKCPLIGDQILPKDEMLKAMRAWTDIMLDHPYLEQRSREDAVDTLCKVSFSKSKDFGMTTKFFVKPV